MDNEKINILIDTDPGDDIDDAVALYISTKEKRLNIVGVTTTFKDTLTRSRIVKKMFNLANINSPVYFGSSLPLSGYIPPSQEINQGSDDLAFFEPDNVREDEAVKFIVDSVKKYDGNITILGIGPLTNIAKAFKRDLKTMQTVKEIIIMGGSFSEDYPEWNMYCDASAAKIVFDNATKLTCVGVDQTKYTNLTIEDTKIIESNQNSELNQYLSFLVKSWRNTHENNTPTLHDCLALNLVLDQNGFKITKKVCSIYDNDDRGFKAGMVNYEAKSNMVNIVTGFDKNKFMNFIMEYFK